MVLRGGRAVVGDGEERGGVLLHEHQEVVDAVQQHLKLFDNIREATYVENKRLGHLYYSPVNASGFKK